MGGAGDLQQDRSRQGQAFAHPVAMRARDKVDRAIGYKTVLGTLNPSDVLTKHVPGDLLDAHLKSLGMEVRGGRAGVAPTLDPLMVEYITDWVEVVNDCRVSFSNVAAVRPIPAAGRSRPVKEQEDRPTLDGCRQI